MNNEAIGDSIARRYRIIEKIGSGGMGSVYKALDTRLQRLVALKVFRRDPVVEQRFSQEFSREADAVARLNHPNIVQIYDLGEADNQVYLAFEYVDGHALSQILTEAKPFDPEYAAWIICQLGSALSYAHQHGVIHRDIKPSNILISNEGRVLLVDFGLATEAQASSLTQTGTIAGTPAYMSPEQVMGERIDERSDIFSLGVVFYELLTGIRPFVGSSTSELLRKVCQESPTQPQEINPSVPSSVAEVVLKCLAKQPEQRFENADDLLNALVAATSSPRRLPEGTFQNVSSTRLFGPSSAARRSSEQMPTALPLDKPVMTAAMPGGPRLRWFPFSLTISILSLMSFVFVFWVAGSVYHIGSSSTQGRSFFTFGVILAFAIVALVLGLVLRSRLASTRPRRRELASAPALSTHSTQSLLDRILDCGPTNLVASYGPPVRLDDDDPTVTDLLPYRPSHSSASEELTQYPSEIPRLRILDGVYPESEFRLTARVTIGRKDDCEILIPDPRISRLHACILLDQERFYIIDLGSKHGTFVNGERIHKHELRDRDKITVGGLNGPLLQFLQSAPSGVRDKVTGGAQTFLGQDKQELLQRPVQVTLSVSPGLLAEAKRRKEFNAIWDQLMDSARHD